MGTEASTLHAVVSEEDAIADLMRRIDDVGTETRRVDELIVSANALARDLADDRLGERRNIRKRFANAMREAERSGTAIEEKLQLIAYEVKTAKHVDSDTTLAELRKCADEYSAAHAALVALSKLGIAKPKVPAMRPHPSSIAKTHRKSRRLASGRFVAPEVPTANRPSSMIVMTVQALLDNKAEGMDAAFPEPAAELSATGVDTMNPLGGDGELGAMAPRVLEEARREEPQEEDFSAPGAVEAEEEEEFAAPGAAEEEEEKEVEFVAPGFEL